MRAKRIRNLSWHYKDADRMYWRVEARRAGRNRWEITAYRSGIEFGNRGDDVVAFTICQSLVPEYIDLGEVVLALHEHFASVMFGVLRDATIVED